LFFGILALLDGNLALLVYQVAESCHSDKGHHPKRENRDPENSFPLALLHKELHAFTLSLTQPFLIFCALSCLLQLLRLAHFGFLQLLPAALNEQPCLWRRAENLRRR
jgi:hypothetical protein